MINNRLKIAIAGALTLCLLCGCGSVKIENTDGNGSTNSAAKAESGGNNALQNAEDNENNGAGADNKGAGAGNSKTDADSDGQNNKNQNSNESKYIFRYGETAIATDEDMAPVLERLGEPDSYFEEPSCAAQGIGKFYTYAGFVIETYPDKDKDLIARVTLKDDSVATPEGVDLSMTRDDIISVYGECDEETDTAVKYTNSDGSKLIFVIEGDYITSIEYDSRLL